MGVRPVFTVQPGWATLGLGPDYTGTLPELDLGRSPWLMEALTTGQRLLCSWCILAAWGKHGFGDSLWVHRL